VTVTNTDSFDVFAPWQLSTNVSLRDEAFGALAYHHGTRRLVFLKSRTLVALVRELSAFECAHDAVRSLVSEDEYDRYVAALASLTSSEILSVRE
jgi:putative mycofactocin binding protein MftB